MVVRAMEAEVALFIDKQADEVDESGHRKVVRNGHMPVRELVTGIGRVPIKQPRVDDRQRSRNGKRDSAAPSCRAIEGGGERGHPDTSAVTERSIDGGFLRGLEGSPGRRSP